MRGLFLVLFLILFISMLHTALAATISGSLYDLSLQKETNAIVEINTIPHQVIVSKDGDYSFEVPYGNYIINAYATGSEGEENVSVYSEGNYTIDIILSDTITMPENYSKYNFENIGSDVSLGIINTRRSSILPVLLVILGLILLIAASAGIIYLKRHKRHRDKSQNRDMNKKILASKLELEAGVTNDRYTLQVASIIKRERQTTQKEIRKAMPLSEAKISLILTQLESEGRIRKIKKGRGNIIIHLKD